MIHGGFFLVSFFLPAIPVGVPEAGGCGAAGGQPQAQPETGESPSRPAGTCSLSPLLQQLLTNTQMYFFLYFQ